MSKPFDWRRYAQGVADYIDDAFKAFGGRVRGLDGRITAMEARINLIESQTKNFAYLGTWEAGRSYKQHNAVTSTGNLWIARAATTTQKPGDGPDWQLAVRKGRDA